MSEVAQETNKVPRPLSEINKEYTALCAQAGQKQYQIDRAQDDLKGLNKALRDINTEAAKAKQYYDELAAKQSATSPVEESKNA